MISFPLSQWVNESYPVYGIGDFKADVDTFFFFAQLAGRRYQAAEEGFAITGKNEGGQWHAIEKLSASLSAGLNFGLETYLPKNGGRPWPRQPCVCVRWRAWHETCCSSFGCSWIESKVWEGLPQARCDNYHINAVTRGGYSDILAKRTFLSRIGRMPWVRNFVVPIVKGSVLDFSVAVGVSLIGTQKWICASTENYCTLLKDCNYLITKPWSLSFRKQVQSTYPTGFHGLAISYPWSVGLVSTMRLQKRRGNF